MMTLISMVVFAGAMALAVAAIWTTVAPQWRRIVRLASGQVDQPFQPLAGLAQAERRIALRRWAGSSRSVIRQRRAAA